MKKLAFTMAEILISLTIIGVIAALTLPTLSGNISSKQFATTYKKAYATVGQALKMGTADGRDASQAKSRTVTNGPDMELGLILMDNVGAKFITTSSTALWTIRASAKSTWGLTDNAIGTDPDDNARNIAINSDYQVFLLKDGMSHLIVRKPTGDRCFGAGKPVYISNSGVIFTGRYCEAFIDVNGSKGPNTIISCANQTTNGVMPATFNVDTAQEVGSCSVSDSAITDVFPVIIYDDKIIPATPAASAVLQN